MFRSNIYHKTRQLPLKARNSGGYINTVWQFIPEVYDSIMEHISITIHEYLVYGFFCSFRLFPRVYMLVRSRSQCNVRYQQYSKKLQDRNG